MYLQHFGLRDQPFTLTPNTRFFFNVGSHREALNVLLVALRSGEGFIKVVGEVGTGKTILCRALLKTLGPGFVTSYVPNPFLSPGSLFRTIAAELGLEARIHDDQHRLLTLLHDRLVRLHRREKRVVLLVDEAQALPDASLEALRLLTNLETEANKLLQVVLFGQPELDVRLMGPRHRPLRQRITFGAQLRPLGRHDVRRYVHHRLACAGHLGGPLFTPSALTCLHRASGGVPRLVNVLCHKSLLAAWGRGQDRIRRRDVRRAAADTDSVRVERSEQGWLSRVLS